MRFCEPDNPVPAMERAVLRGSQRDEMFWIDAGPNLTTVMYLHPVWDRPLRQFVGDNVGVAPFTDAPVAFRMYGSGPEGAGVGHAP